MRTQIAKQAPAANPATSKQSPGEATALILVCSTAQYFLQHLLTRISLRDLSYQSDRKDA
jgi:hypothetical protein